MCIRDRNNQCGFKSVVDLLVLAFYEPAFSKEFKDIWEAVEPLGYQMGLTVQAIPYDFRKSMRTNEANYTLERSIRFMRDLTGKKVVIAAHSMGNLVTLHTLNRLTAEDKSNLIKHYVSMAAPFTGAMKALDIAIGGNKDYMIGLNIGFHYPGQAKFIESHPSTFDLLPRDPLRRFAQEEWMQEIQQLMALEEKLEHAYDNETSAEIVKEIKENSDLFSFLPLANVNCSKGFTQRDDRCLLGIYDSLNKPIVNITGEFFTTERKSMINLLENHSIKHNNIEDFYEETDSSGIDDLKNPEVPTSLMFYSHLPTLNYIAWNNEPRNRTEANQFYFSDSQISGPGDGVVPRAGALITGLKWAYEFEKKEKVPNLRPQPVKFVDMCSIYNVKDAAYDGSSETGEHVMTTNDYQGLDCDCQNKANSSRTLGDNCYHSTIINDKFAIEYLIKILDSNEMIDKEVVQPKALSLTPEEIASIVTECYTCLLYTSPSPRDQA
eukprot:TRINITY_DN20296_c0_g1_i1.p1 TRINITY_DN20296_c0_g1~~TRINITY_DN20296_c0_g1_i1.p1  ORF type:complete len:493 (-),score=125.04 TRINITY_DN20296_c0_g1_i1:34-1512(-)